MSDKLIVTGTGKSGTHYLQAYFNALGLNMGHEQVFTVYGVMPWNDFDGAVSFVAAGEAGYIDETDYVIHATRNPLKVLRTWLSDYHDEGGFFGLESDHEIVGPFVKYFQRKVPEVYQIPDIMGRTIKYIVDWNAKCELISDHRIQVETLSLDKIDHIVDRFNLNDSVEPKIPPLMGQAFPPAYDWLEWDNVLDHPLGSSLADLAIKYGYEVK